MCLEYGIEVEVPTAQIRHYLNATGTLLQVGCHMYKRAEESIT
jgi:hypothetical protein